MHKRTGITAFGSPLLSERFWSKATVADDGCWPWQGTLNEHGYGRFAVDGNLIFAHRMAYEAMVGAIPAGLVIDHLCRTRHCVNPWHMEPVVRRVNTLRGIGHTAVNFRKTHCIRGHEFNEVNTMYSRGGAKRTCRTCQARRSREYWHRKAARSVNVT